MTRSKLYQSMTSGASSQIYSDVDSSIMSVLSEVLNLRTDSRMSRSVSGFPERSASRLQTIEEDSVDTCSLLHTIEEIRNSSLCNLYYSSNSDLSKPLANVPPNQPPLAPRVPLVPPRNNAGYSSLVKENQQGSKVAHHTPDLKVATSTPDLNESIKSVHSNTLVLTPPTVKAKNPKSAHLNGRGGVRKNILNLVGSTNDILNTPKRVKLPGAGGEKKLSLPAETHLMSDSLMSEHNEFKSLVPHLTSQGAKFLSKVKANSGTESDLEASRNTSICGYNGDFTTFTDTPSPKVFVRNIDHKPRRKFSILRQRFEEVEEDTSDYKYGFMPENPDAKYGFGVFGPETSYNLVETAKLSSGSGLVLGRSAPNIPGSYSLSALNRGSTDFKLGPDQQYANFARDSWSSASLQRRPSRAGGIGDRGDAARRSMSILDDYEEKENIGPPRPLLQPKRRPPLAPLNKTSPMKILGNNIHSPQTRVYQLNPNRSTLSPTSKIFRKKSES